MSVDMVTDYGRPMKYFFHCNSELLGLGRQIGQVNSEAFGVFLAELSAPMLVQTKQSRTSLVYMVG